MSLKFISICSGIEAASMAWEPLGWTPLAFSEIEPFPCAVLKHHYPHVPNFGDMTKFDEWPEDVLAECDVLVGGCPCQAFSVAGLRQSLADARGNLTLVFVKLINHIDAIRSKHGRPPIIIVYENVPGILSTGDNAFGNFLGALSGEDGPLEPPGGKWTNAGLVCGPTRDLAWRILDAQYFGVAQRRRRVFLVGHSRAGSLRPVKVLLVEQGVQRHSPPSREAGQRAAAVAARGAEGGGGGLGAGHDGGRGGVAYGFNFEQFSGTEGPISPCLTKTEHKGKTLVYDGPHVVAPPRATFWNGSDLAETLTATSDDQRMPDKGRMQMVVQPMDSAHNGGGLNGQDAYTGRVLPVVQCVTGERTHALKAEGADGSEDGTGRGTPIVTSIGFYPTEGRDFPAFNELSPTVKVGSGGTSGNPPGVMSAMAVRRLTPVEHAPGETTYMITDYRTNTFSETNLSGPLTTSRTMFRSAPLAAEMAVRRLTPIECERLQGFPDDYTRIPWKGKPASECPDGPRYKALGNSMAVPCMYWIGWQIRKAMT